MDTPQEDFLATALLQQIRGGKDDLKAYLFPVVEEHRLVNSRTTVRTYHIAIDGNGRPKIEAFASLLSECMTDYAIPRSEIARAVKSDLESKSSRAMTRLVAQARRLFAKVEKSGEGGELLLALLAETILELPQIFAKMSLKTNSQVHFHGTDGIHAKAREDGGLALYWGESKLYKDPNRAIKDCLNSIAPYLHGTGSNTSIENRDLQLLRDNLDLNDASLSRAIIEYLDRDNPKSNQREVRGLALVGCDCESYNMTNLRLDSPPLKSLIFETLDQRYEKISAIMHTLKLLEIEIEMFYLPFPDVEQFRLSILKELGV